MKKAMLFLVAFLFSVSASAATLTLTENTAINATQVASAVVNNGPVALGSGETTGGLWSSYYTLTTDEDTQVSIEWSFNPEPAVVGALVGYALLPTQTLFAVAGDFATTTTLLAGETYLIGFKLVQSSALSYDLSVSEVPVPAAAFLIAPALLGFMGLRRKAAKAA